VVAGDVAPDEVRRLAEKYYGPIPAADTPPRDRPQEPQHRAARRVDMKDPRVSQPAVVRSYLAPTRYSGPPEKAAALSMLASLLGGDPVTSHFGRRLQVERKIAVGSGVFYDSSAVDPSAFSVYVAPVDGVSLETAEAAMDEEIEAFVAKGPDPEDMTRIKRQVRAEQIYSQDSAGGLARRYGDGLAKGATIEEIQEWPRLIEAVTAEDVVAAAKEVFDITASVTGYLSSGADTAAEADGTAAEAEERG